MRTSDFDYELPEPAIAQVPVEPRDSARLLGAADLSDHRFSELADLVDPADVVVVNDTRVRAARLHLRKEPSGGSVELLLLERVGPDEWTALVRPARRLREGTRLVGADLSAVLVSDPDDGFARVVLQGGGEVEAAIEREGEMPLPPYITRVLADPDRYQTVYARAAGSAAAPTAGLHFTEPLMRRLGERVAGVVPIELRVGLGTFRPIATDDIDDHAMHREWASVPESAVERIGAARAAGGKVVAVGTTVVRALESASLGGDDLQPWDGYTDLFIRPGFRFRVVDRLVTNFHLPRSSLVVMVAAFMGPAWREAYRTALDRGYRFLSFGDAMLADREAP